MKILHQKMKILHQKMTVLGLKPADCFVWQTLLAGKHKAVAQVAIPIKMDELFNKDDELCIKNDGFCITNDGLNTNAQDSLAALGLVDILSQMFDAQVCPIVFNSIILSTESTVVLGLGCLTLTHVRRAGLGPSGWPSGRRQQTAGGLVRRTHTHSPPNVIMPNVIMPRWAYQLGLSVGPILRRSVIVHMTEPAARRRYQQQESSPRPRPRWFGERLFGVGAGACMAQGARAIRRRR